MVASAFAAGGSLDDGSGTLILDTSDGDCVLNLVRDNRYDWVYVQPPPGFAESADQWLFSVAELLLTRFPFRVGFLLGDGVDGLGTLIIDMADSYERDGLPASLRCDYLCPEGDRLAWRRQGT